MMMILVPRLGRNLHSQFQSVILAQHVIQQDSSRPLRIKNLACLSGIFSNQHFPSGLSEFSGQKHQQVMIVIDDQDRRPRRRGRSGRPPREIVSASALSPTDTRTSALGLISRRVTMVASGCVSCR